MITNVYSFAGSRSKPHRKIVAAEVKRLKERGHFITEVRRVINSWWGLLGDEDYTQIVHHKREGEQ